MNISKSYRSIPNLKLLLFSLLMSGVSVGAFAQFGLAVGPKIGVGIASLRGSDINNVDAHTSWLGGLFLNAQITPSITIQPELLFTQRGGDFTSNNSRRNITINYFEIPVLAKLRLPIDDVVFPHILLGPNFSYRTNLKYTSFDTETGTAISVNESDIKNSDIGAVFGAGIDVQTRESGLYFTLDGRYGLGFNNIHRNGNALNIKNTGWSFAAGIGFLFSR